MSYATKEQLAELAAYMASQINVPTIGIGGGYAPIGTIISYMGTTAPQDYLACDGSTKNIADYPQLADFFEAQFGSKNYFGGDGVTTFAVPDLQGEFLRGTGTNSHTNQGSGGEVGEHQDATIINNVVGTDGSGNGLVWYDNAFTTDDNRDTSILASSSNTGAVKTTKATTSNTNMSHTSRPTNTSVLYCIKAVVAGDVYSTEERVVGTWIDGKKLYQKCYQGVFPSTLGHGIDIGNISDILGYDTSDVAITKIIGVVKWSAGSQYGTVSIPYYLDNPGSSGNTGNWLSLYTDESVGKIKANIGTTSPVKNCPYTLVIQYTKTTD